MALFLINYFTCNQFLEMGFNFLPNQKEEYWLTFMTFCDYIQNNQQICSVAFIPKSQCLLKVNLINNLLVYCFFQ